MAEPDLLSRYRRGPLARQQDADRRYEQIHALIVREQLPTTGRGAWARIHFRLQHAAPHLLVTARLPRGQTLDNMPPYWLFKHTYGVRSLRQGYQAWSHRTGTDCTVCPKKKRNGPRPTAKHPARLPPAG
jgi:hypothetical protein